MGSDMREDIDMVYKWWEKNGINGTWSENPKMVDIGWFLLLCKHESFIHRLIFKPHILFHLPFYTCIRIVVVVIIIVVVG